ncbi:hypothetical protein THAOC_20964 [Thalassiosira oceanica]|uniref:Uncharacterized protein n=1 Tax=Thalassiosira oceanica TaxID=159749 RepID=K0S0M2_THAOC|nr:hypothetical protein THAOC_20964 [Thalassiosira oceanica]|eukprot:EJK58880.1 hypothetical protein THAOC_20964 [Thalassiosira oceanica]
MAKKGRSRRWVGQIRGPDRPQVETRRLHRAIQPWRAGQLGPKSAARSQKGKVARDHVDRLDSIGLGRGGPAGWGGCRPRRVGEGGEWGERVGCVGVSEPGIELKVWGGLLGGLGWAAWQCGSWVSSLGAALLARHLSSGSAAQGQQKGQHQGQGQGVPQAPGLAQPRLHSTSTHSSSPAPPPTPNTMAQHPARAIASCAIASCSDAIASCAIASCSDDMGQLIQLSWAS